MSRELFNLAVDRLKNISPTGYISITLDYGVTYELYDLKIAKGKTNIARGRTTHRHDTRAYHVYFEISKLLDFRVYEECEDAKEEDSD